MYLAVAGPIGSSASTRYLAPVQLPIISDARSPRKEFRCIGFSVVLQMRGLMQIDAQRLLLM